MARSVVARGQKHLIEYDDVLGKHVSTLTIHDQHYHDGSAWQPVDESLVDDASVPGFVASCDKTAHIVRFGAGGERRWYPRRDHPDEYVQTSKPDYWTGSRWRVWNLTGLTRGTNSATWETADYQVRVTNTWRQLKLSYTLKTASAYPRVRYPWTLVGLTYDAATHEFISTTDSAVVGSVNEPHATDANGADVPVTGTYSGGYFEIVLTPGSAAYPVTMDPDDTFTDGYGGDTDTAYDTHVQPENATTRLYGLADVLYAKLPSGTLNNYDTSAALFKFTLTVLNGVTVSSATFTYTRPAQAWGGGSLYVRRVLSANDWAESCNWDYASGTDTVRWAGDAAANGGMDAGCSQSGTDYSSTAMATVSLADGRTAGATDVTLGLTEFGTMVTTNRGIVLHCTANISEAICSSDHATTGSRPKLVVVYTSGGGGATPVRYRALLGVGI